MFDVEFFSLDSVSVIERKEMEFLFERSDIVMLKNNLYTVIQTKIDAPNGVVQKARTLVLRIT